ncbi:MAG: response regulator [Candidatus Jacksonbacteria bacterium]
MENNFEKQIAPEKQERKSKICVAIIDDNKDIRESTSAYIEEFFRANVFSFSKYSNEARDHILQTQPNLVIMDLNLGYDSWSGVVAAQDLKKAGYQGKIFFTTKMDKSIVKKMHGDDSFNWTQELIPKLKNLFGEDIVKKNE